MSENVVQMTIRLEPEFHKACLDKSDDAGQSLAEWIRRAMKEKLERESNPQKQTFRDMSELEAYVEKAVAKAIENKLNQTEK